MLLGLEILSKIALLTKKSKEKDFLDVLGSFLALSHSAVYRRRFFIGPGKFQGGENFSLEILF